MKEYIEPDQNGQTPLQKAAIRGQLDQVVKDLAASGESLPLDYFFAEDHGVGWCLSHWAVHHGQLDQMRKLYEAAGEQFSLRQLLVKSNKIGGYTPVHLAASMGDLDQVNELLQASGEQLTLQDLLMKDDHGWTPVYWAADKGYLDQIFIPSLWKGRVGDMWTLWKEVPKEKQGTLDFPAIMKEAIQLSVDACPKVDAATFAGANRAVPSSTQAEPLRSLVK